MLFQVFLVIKSKNAKKNSIITFILLFFTKFLIPDPKAAQGEIEIGQIITLLPLIILIPLFNRLSWYRILIAIPASIIIALFGADMFIDRVL